MVILCFYIMKLICFDLDGTIIDETIFIWQTIHDALQTDKELRKKYMEQYHNGEINYSEWADIDINMWKEKGANKEKLMQAISALRLMDGAKETLKELKKKGYTLAIISGSLNIALEKVLPDYKKIFDHVYINKLYFDSNGDILHLEPTDYDVEHKATALKQIVVKENIDLKDTVFIGDNWNDIHIAETAGFSIAFNCKSDELAQISDVVIMEKDLRKVLEFI